VIGFVAPEQLMAVAEAVITTQRDHGNRSERQYARLKYTIDHKGLDWFRREVEKRLGFELAAPRPYHFDQNGDEFGWRQGEDGLWHLGLYIESGRLWDVGQGRLQTGIREIALMHQGEFRLTCNQNLIISNVADKERKAIDELVAKWNLDGYKAQSGVRRHSIACVALPTCGLAMAESERYAPELLEKLESLLDHHGLLNAPLSLRISGCPNGCSRPYLGEIALVGRALGRYDLRLGADFTGQRLNVLYRQNIAEAQILEALDALFAGYAQDRLPQEYFGDYLVRAGIVAAPTQNLIPIVCTDAAALAP